MSESDEIRELADCIEDVLQAIIQIADEVPQQLGPVVKAMGVAYRILREGYDRIDY